MARNPADVAPQELEQELVTRYCGRCKTEFWAPAASQSRFCSGKCASAAWHGSPEGLQWHREHGRRDWGNRELVTRNCDRCGKEYDTPFPDRSRFCSPNCSRAVREAAGAYDIWVKCPMCGIEFSRSKYNKKKAPTTCSRICGQRLRRQKGQ